MTSPQRLERDLPSILGDLAMGPYPDYIDDVLATTAQQRQRPAWSFPERWLPMVDIARQPVLAPRLPWRAISLAAVMIALLLAATAFFIGTQPRAPEPFGVARNGVVAYEGDGDIYTADPVTGIATAIVSSPETDVGPRFSRDGTHVVFERKLDRGSQLYVARSDGSDLTLVTPDPIHLTQSLLGDPWDQYQFSPDGRSIVIAASDRVRPNLWIAQSDGSGIRPLDVGMPAYEPSFRPPDGAEILFVGTRSEPGWTSHGVFAVDPATNVVRTIVEPTANYDLAGANWSPDGSQVAYYLWGGPSDGINAMTHVVSADGTGDQELPVPADADWNVGSEWSNDGTRLFVLRGYTPDFANVRAAVVPADGRSAGYEVPYPGVLTRECCAAWEWAPDDTKVLGTPVDDIRRRLPQIILDVETGTFSPAPWGATSDPVWQRRAP
jgi:Tol biopolymer transport system component